MRFDAIRCSALLVLVEPEYSATSGKVQSVSDRYIKKGILYAKEIGPLPDALFSPPQSEEQCCELDRSTARLLALESHREALAYDSPVFVNMSLLGYYRAPSLRWGVPSGILCSIW